MAIALRGTPTTATTAAAGTLTVTLSAGVVAKDVIFFTIGVGGAAHIPATPAGLTLLDSASLGPSYATYYRVCDGTEGASFAFTVAAASAGTCRAYSGVDNVAPINAHGAPNKLATTTSTATTITTTVNGCELVFGAFMGNAETSFTNPAGFANQAFASTSVASCDESQTTAGATGSVSGTWVSVANNNYANLTALAPASSLSAVDRRYLQAVNRATTY